MVEGDSPRALLLSLVEEVRNRIKLFACQHLRSIERVEGQNPFVIRMRQVGRDRRRGVNVFGQQLILPEDCIEEA